jgi:DNA-binding SARP family transcriptional activator/predicted ATPase
MSQRMLFLFGAPRLEREGVNVAFERRKAFALLAYLATTPGAHSRDTLAALLWPDADATQGRANLRRALVDVREVVGPDALDADGDRVALRAGALFADAARFQACATQVEAHRHGREPLCGDCLSALAEAADLYRGGFLAGFTLRDAPDFDTWQTFQSESLRLELGETLEKLALAHGERCDFEHAIPYARRWLALDPLSEPAHRCLMLLYAGSGDRAAAFSQYETCRNALKAELGIPPDPETVALYEQLKAGVVPDCRSLLPAGIGVMRPIVLRRVNNLPALSGVFMGRERELAEIAKRLADPACRLLTLLGPGGIGKTRLAIEAGRAELQRFPHGACFVSLVAVSAPDLVPATILQALGGAPAGRLTLEQQVAEFLRERGLLLVLDNCEHLLADAPGIADEDLMVLLRGWLDAAPGLKLLVTSRERLNIRDEWLLPLAGLELPAWREQPGALHTDREPEPAPELDAHAATRFFLHCASRIQPGFAPDADSACLVAAICRHVDGIPLAIELVAPWLRGLPLADISRRLAQSLDLLASTQRDLPPRHRSMRAVFDQSWRLLTAHERAVLRCCSVFRDGFTAEAAQVITGASLADMMALVDRSWLWLLPSGRYDLHELVRQYCAEKLQNEHSAEAGESPHDVFERHDMYYTDQLVRWDQACRAAGYRVLENLSFVDDFGKLEDALRRAAQADNVERMTPFVSLFDLQSMFNPASRNLALLTDATDRLREFDRASAPGRMRDAAAHLRAHLVLHKGACYAMVARWDETEKCTAECRAILTEESGRMEAWEDLSYFLRLNEAGAAHARGDRAAAIRAQTDILASMDPTVIKPWQYRPVLTHQWNSVHLGAMLMEEGRYDEGRRAIESGLARLKGLHRLFPMYALSETLWHQGEYQDGKRVAHEAMQASRELHSPYHMGIALMELGRNETSLGEVAEARAHFEQSLSIARSGPSPQPVATCLAGLGQLEIALGHPMRAKEFYQEVLDLLGRWNMQGEFGAAFAWLGLGQAAAAMNDRRQAMDCYRRALRIRKRFQRVTMEAIASAAEIIALDGDPVRAAELLAFIVAHPYTPAWVRVSARKLLIELEAELPPDVFAAAAARGWARELGDAVAEIAGDTEAIATGS